MRVRNNIWESRINNHHLDSLNFLKLILPEFSDNAQVNGNNAEMYAASQLG